MGYSKQITYNTIGNVLSLFFQWLIIMIIPRITDFSEAGVFAVAISVCSILNIIATFSLNQYQVADQYIRYSENGYRLTRLITIILSFIMILPFIFIFEYSTEQILVIVAYMVYRNFIHFAMLYVATLQIYDRLDYVGIATGVEGIISFISFLVTYLTTGNLLLSTLIMALAGGGFYLLALISGYHRIIKGKIGIRFSEHGDLVPLLKVGIPIMLSTIAAIIITALPKLLLQADFGDEITGVFSTLSAPTIVVPTLATSVFAPFIVHYSNICRSGDMSLLCREYVKLIIITLLFGVVCVIGSILLAPWFFGTIYGDSLIEHMGDFHILVVGIILYTIGINGSTVMITKNQGHAVAVSSLLAMVVSFGILTFTVPNYGLAGASYGLMVSYAVFALFVSACVFILPLKKVID